MFLAIFIVVCSILGIVGVSVVVIVTGWNAPTAMFVFAAIMPLQATWIGLILGWTFAKDYFLAADRAVRGTARPEGQDWRGSRLAFETIKSGGEHTVTLATLLGKMQDAPRIMRFRETIRRCDF